VSAPSFASLAVAAYVTFAPPVRLPSTVIGPGSVRTGAVFSCTLTGNVAVDELPVASVAVHVTVESPIGSVEPDAGAQATVGFGSTASLADGAL
jgi:hypothetical protein